MTERRWVRCDHGLLEHCHQCAFQPRAFSERQPVRHDVLVYLCIALLLVAAAIAGTVSVS